MCKVLNHPFLKAIKSKFKQIRCAHITSQVLEETRLFLGQRLGPNNFTDKELKSFSADNLIDLIKYVRCNKLLVLVTIPRQWNNQYNGNNWATCHDKGHRGNMQTNGVFSDAVPMPKGSYPYSLLVGNGTVSKTPQGMGWKEQSL